MIVTGHSVLPQGARITVETEHDLQSLQRIGAIVADCLAFMSRALETGITTAELDALGRSFLESRGARSAPEATYQFPGATCISVNNEVAHGVPGPRKIAAGDVVNIDVSAILDGYVADTGGTFIVPPETKAKRHLLDATWATLHAAMDVARAGQPVRAIGGSIEASAKKHGLSIIRNLGSHGVGRALHEEPGFIAPYYERKDRRMLKAGMVITIEPFLSTGATAAREGRDGWTLSTPQGFLSAQFEHTLVIGSGKPIVITQPTAAM